MRIIASLIPILCLSSSIMAQDMNLHITKEIDYYKYSTKVHPGNFQDSVHYQEDKFGKNAFYISGMVGTQSYFLVNYEHIIINNPDKSPILLFARIAGGLDDVQGHLSRGIFGLERYVEPYTNFFILNTIIVLTGRKANHLELSGGYCLYFWDDYNPITSDSKSPVIVGAGGIGYRYQKPGRTFVFRIGLALPVEGLYLGFGAAF